MVRAVIFDFDGLILDTEEPVFRSWVEVYEEHGAQLPFERWVEIVGSTTTGFHPQRHLEELLGRPLQQEVLDRRVVRRTEFVHAKELLPGVLQHIEEARVLGLKLGVASSSTTEWVSGHLTRLGILDRFDCLRCRDDVAKVKPAPDLYLAMLECLESGPRRLLRSRTRRMESHRPSKPACGAWRYQTRSPRVSTCLRPMSC
jgi:beta-phosphoglucomutase-like phosphatase (HAD superfamily)